MPKKDDIFDPENPLADDKVIFDDTDPTYDYIGRAPREEVKAAGAGGTAAAIWHIERTSKTAPYTTEKVTNRYDQIWDNRAGLTYY